MGLQAAEQSIFCRIQNPVVFMLTLLNMKIQALYDEKEIAAMFDSLKAKYGRDIFGQGYIYKIIDDSKIADADSLIQDDTTASRQRRSTTCPIFRKMSRMPLSKAR